MTEFIRNLAVIIGINDYQNGIQPLKTATQDARKLANILQTHHHYQLIHPTASPGKAVLDSAATLSQLRQLFTEVLPKQIQPSQGDRLLIYFAGHGITRQISDQGPQGFLVPQDADTSHPDSLLSMRELYKSLHQLECRHLLVILDCCFAGMFRWAGTRKVIVEPETIHWEHYHRFIKYPAWQVITSAAHNQEALDYLDNRGTGASGQHSPFAEALFKGLLEQSADLIPDGVITTPELYLYLRQCVEVQSREQQTPGFWPLSKHDRGEYIFQLVPDDKLKLKPAPKLEKDNNPYRGLEAFEERHARFFFGREEVIKTLIAHISQPQRQFTVVDSISGSGKSSLVKAGLLPKLKNQPDSPWQILPVIRPGAEPYVSLASVICPSEQATPSKLRHIAAQLQHSPEDFHQQIKSWSAQNPGKKLLLVIDQFEELITLEPRPLPTARAKNRGFLSTLNFWKKSKSKTHEVSKEHTPRWQTIAEILANALESCPALHLLVTIRSDFSPRFQESALSPKWAEARFVVRPMHSDELREAVIGPANEMALYFEPPELVDRLVDEVAQTPGALPLLSFTLSELYLKLHDAWRIEGKEDRALTVDQEFDGRGGVAGLLAGRANEEYDQLPDDKHQATMQQVMLRMVELEGVEAVKRRVPRTELVYPTEAENTRVEIVLKRLDQARLIVGGEEAGEAYVEPAHDFLVRGWDRLQQWIQQGQETLLLQRLLVPAVSNWQSAKTDLWNGNSRLDTLKQVSNSQQSWLNKAENNFIKKSVSRKRRNVQLRWAGFSSVLAASVIAGIVLNEARQEADAQRQEAVAQKEEAERRSALQLAETAKVYANDGRTVEALLYAVNAVGEGKRLWQPLPSTIKSSLLEATAIGYELNVFPAHSEGEVTDLAVSSDGKTIVSGELKGNLKVWTLEGVSELTQAISLDDSIDKVLISSEGTTVVFVTNIRVQEDEEWKTYCKAYVWNRSALDTQQSTQQKPIQIGDEYSCWADISDNGRVIITGNTQGELRLWGKSGEALWSQPKQVKDLSDVAISSDGTKVAALGDAELYLFDNQGKSIWETPAKTLPRSSHLVITPTEQIFVAANHSVYRDRFGTLSKWDIQGSPSVQDTISIREFREAEPSDEVYEIYEKIPNHINDLSITSEENIYISSGSNKSIYFPNFSDSASREVPMEWTHSAQPSAITATADGKTLFIGDEEGNVHIWGKDTRNNNIAKQYLRTADSSESNSDGYNNHERTLIDISDSGETIVTAENFRKDDGNAYQVQFWSSDGLPLLKAPIAIDGQVSSISLSADGETLVGTFQKTGEENNSHNLQVWNNQGDELLNAPISISGNRAIAAISPDSTSIISGSSTAVESSSSVRDAYVGSLQRWSLEGQPLWENPINVDGEISTILFSPSGEMIISSSNQDFFDYAGTSVSGQSQVHFWSLEGKSMLAKPLEAKGYIRDIAFSFDGEIITALSNYMTRRWGNTIFSRMQAWNRKGEAIHKPIELNDYAVPNPALFIAGTSEGDIYFAGGRSIQAWDKQRQAIFSSSLSLVGEAFWPTLTAFTLTPDGRYMSAGITSEEGTGIMLWDLSADGLLTLGCQKLQYHRILSHPEEFSLASDSVSAVENVKATCQPFWDE